MRYQKYSFAIMLQGLVLALGISVASQFAMGQDVAKASSNDLKGNAQCTRCHDDEDIHPPMGSHATADCATCHKGGADHLVSRKNAAGKPDAAACLTCHKDDAKRMNWTFADHHKAGLECSSCHGMHAAKDIKRLDLSLWKADKNTALCATCHQDVLARFNMRSHHPVKEGAMSCTSCHDQHGGKQTSLTSKTAECTQCHQAVRGPHMFEHAPVAEDCATCHNPHGSQNRKMLKLAEPMLCLQCHSVAGNRHGQGSTAANSPGLRISPTALRNCSSCHNAVHGSGIDQHLRF
jgi:DmsE family decaheme c-type cytochrome